MKTKRILAIIFGLLLGGLLIFTGSKDLVHSIQLIQRGKATTAEVLSGRERVSGRSRSHSYYLTVLFHDDANQSVRQELKVNEATYLSGQAKESTKVFYLPEASTICAAGDQVELRYGNLCFGLLILGGAVLLIFQFKLPVTMEEVAERIEGKLQPMMAPRHDYVPANVTDFKHLDMAFYDESQRFLEQHGFLCQGDRENVTLRKAHGTRTMLRLFLSKGRITQAFLYHLNVSTGLTSRDFKVLDLQTMFSNGAFVCTSNAKSAGKLESPAAVLHEFLPEATQQTVLETHTKRVSEYLAPNPGLAAVTINGPEDFQKVMDALQKLKADFRQQQGLSKEELERISGKSGPEIEQLADILRKRWETRSLQTA